MASATARATEKTVANTEPARGQLVPGRNGGMIRRGNLPGSATAGPGRPPDAIRAALRNLAAEKSLPFLESLFDGAVKVAFVGTCANCKTVQGLPEGDAWTFALETATASIADSLANRLKASEQTLKYGLPTKADATSVEDHPEFARKVGALRQALVELCGEELAGRVVARASELSV